MCLLLRYVVLYGVLVTRLPPCLCFTHWVVTEDGKIEYQVSSPFNLRQPYDLMAFTQQEKRISLLKDLKQQLTDYRNEFELYSGYESFDASYRASNPECRNVKFISSYDLMVSTVLPLKYKGINFFDHLIFTANPPPAEPHCTLTPLDFSVWALEHLEGVQWRRGLVTPPEKTVLSAMDMRMELFGSLVHHAMQQNKTSWVLFNLASLYWRARGNAYHAVECIRRALHYSPHHAMDIALLNLANVLHRSHHSQDALIALRVAADLSPSVSVLQFTLGNVHASLKDLNSSALCYKRCMELDQMGHVCQDMHLSAVCERRMELASRQHSDKMDDTQKKLDLFYSNIDQVKQQQATGSVAMTPTMKIAEWQDIARKEEEIVGAGRTGNTKRVEITINDGGIEDRDSGVGLTDATPVLDSEMVLGGTKKDVEASTYEGHLDLEEALDQALNNETESRTKKGHRHSRNRSGGDDRVLHSTRANLRVVVKLSSPPDLAEEIETKILSLGNQETRSVNSGYCLNEVRSLFMQMSPNMDSKEIERSQFLESVNEDSMSGMEPHDSFGLSSQHKDEVLMFELVERDVPPPQHVAEDLTKLTPRREYPKDYHNLEFLPYHPLPDYLETELFPSQATPLPPYHDPYWPRKKECIEMAGVLKGSPGLASYTSTFVSSEARGLSSKELLASVPEDLPYEMRRKPYCTKMVELPLSMAAMDHLEPMLKRTDFKPNNGTGEMGLRKVVVTRVQISLNMDLSFEESGERIYAAMTQHDPNWILFDLASLYWRVKGDPTQSIECLRRAVHFAPWKDRDIGYLGLANVFFHRGYLNEAVIMARAALDISRGSPVAHYTLAHIYLALHAYVAANLHLRAALQVQPEFGYALSSLRIVRCSLKFKEEKIFLRQKMREAEQAALCKQEEEIRNTLEGVVKDGVIKRQTQPVLVIENIEPPEITELSMGEMIESPFTGDDAVRYLTRLALRNQAGRSRGEGDGNGGEGDGNGGRVHQDKSVLAISSDGTGMDEKEDIAEQVSKGLLNDGDVADTSKGTLIPFEAGSEDGAKDSQRKKKRKRRRRRKSKRSGSTPTIEEIRRANLEELERETSEIIKEAAEMLNRNQTPVVRRTPAKVYKVPRGVALPLKTGKVSSKSSKASSKTSKASPNDNTQNSPKAATPTKSSRENEGKGNDLHDSKLEDRVIPVASEKMSTSTLPVEQGNLSKVRVKPTACEAVFSTEMHECLVRDKIPTNAVETGDSTIPVKEMEASPPHPVLQEEELIRDDEKLSGIRPWPTLEKCEEKPLPKGVAFTSTWLSVTAKGVKVQDHIDSVSIVKDHHVLLPYCHNNFEQSEKTLSHLAGMNNQPLIQYKAEKGIQEILCTFDGKKRSLNEMATRIKLAMNGNSSSWVLSTLAALYWRIVGQGQQAIKCLKHTLYYSEDNARDIALVSLTNVLYHCGYDLDAAKVIQMSLELSPTLVVNHYTMANILAAQGLYVESAEFYESTLQYQPEFQPAAKRLRIVRCLMLVAKKNLQQRPVIDRA